eukprot:CAMPEP_0185591250 /NCGR_PEP_ID=MMETSP0434-20130131/63913_1 /TAXON_ID=626734 ORGANISM="Favella taraikaensis, Strain Fe Narragansett Bay" /NCGR_SAMPLE_ID=MMETSP0434 /ASSEMBLY_ACC=CAM_ASM_000379 /LENGTH=64 /DNA_ID=CAMNT_0028216111 /DNA_START=1387 /DNA_END=1581 /DNA_ORIENTATION=+
MAELEAAMVYYRDLIELKLGRGEEVPEGDRLCVLLESACDAYEKFLEQYMSVEEIIEGSAGASV